MQLGWTLPFILEYKELELGPEKLSTLEMGYIYEELLRRFSEQSGEEAGEHFTPREVIRLMVELLDIPLPNRHISIYDRNVVGGSFPAYLCAPESAFAVFP